MKALNQLGLKKLIQLSVWLLERGCGCASLAIEKLTTSM